MTIDPYPKAATITLTICHYATSATPKKAKRTMHDLWLTLQQHFVQKLKQKRQT